jgi:hypothetical protein
VGIFHSGDVKFGFRDLDSIFELDISNVWEQTDFWGVGGGGGGEGFSFSQCLAGSFLLWRIPQL